MNNLEPSLDFRLDTTKNLNHFSLDYNLSSRLCFDLKSVSFYYVKLFPARI